MMNRRSFIGVLASLPVACGLLKASVVTAESPGMSFVVEWDIEAQCYRVSAMHPDLLVWASDTVTKERLITNGSAIDDAKAALADKICEYRDGNRLKTRWENKAARKLRATNPFG